MSVEFATKAIWRAKPINNALERAYLDAGFYYQTAHEIRIRDNGGCLRWHLHEEERVINSLQ